jgi:acetyl-CoA carboxylase carboxyl transferase subunit alpha
MGITAARLKSLGLVDRVVSEPLGGAHRDHRQAAQNLRRALQESLRAVSELSSAELIERRLERVMSYGKFKEQAAA